MKTASNLKNNTTFTRNFVYKEYVTYQEWLVEILENLRNDLIHKLVQVFQLRNGFIKYPYRILSNETIQNLEKIKERH